MGNECFESNDSMADLFGRHKNRVSCSIQKLTRDGYIENVGTNKFNRRLITTQKEININGVSSNINDVSFNTMSVLAITRMFKEINKSGVKKVTKAVLEINKSGDIYIELNKIFNKELNKEKIIEKEKSLPNDFIPATDTIETLQKESYPTEQIDKALIAFKDYWIDGDGKGKKKKNWQSAFRNWIRKSKPWASLQQQPIDTSQY